MPSQGVEFIFIDNASTYNTAKILALYTDKLPLTILYAVRQGESFAIPKGIKQYKAVTNVIDMAVSYGQAYKKTL